MLKTIQMQMRSKSVTRIAVRMGKELSDEIDDLLAETEMAYNKQEFTLFAMKKTLSMLMYGFNITAENQVCDYEAVSDILKMIASYKSEYNKSREDLQQFIISVPQGLHEKISDMCYLLGISIQDFVKTSIMVEMKYLGQFKDDYELWHKTVANMDAGEFRSMVKKASKHV